MNRSALPDRSVSTGLVLALAFGVVPAQTSQNPSDEVNRPTLERRLGEEEQIRNRQEWFFSTRTQGTSNADERARLRGQAVARAKAQLTAQRSLRAEGLLQQQNPWAPKGPTPSNFGGWAFGTVAGRATALAGDWNAGILYFGTAAGGLWKSYDDGQSWNQLFDDVGTMAIGAVAVDPNDPNVVWAGTGDNVVGCESYFGLGLFRSPDGGQTWEPRNGSGADTLENLAMFASIVVDPSDSNHLVVGGRFRQCNDGSQLEGGIYTSDDAGLTWTKRLDSKQVYEIQQDPAVTNTYWAATDDGIYKSTDDGVTWNQQSGNGLPTNGVGRCELAVAPSDGNTVYALFASGPSLWRTTDGGATWQQRASGNNACDGQCWYNMVLRVKIDDPDTVYRGTIRSFRSTNGGSNWVDLTGGWGPNQKVHQDTHVLVMHPTLPEVYYTGTDGGLWKSIDAGSTFTNLNGNINSFLFYAIGVDAQDPERICGGAQDNSSVARTGNNVWSLQAVTGDGFTCHINPVDPDYSYITSYPSGGWPNVWRSTSGLFGGYADISGSGSGIINGDRINWVTPYLLNPINPNILYLGTHRIYKSINFGTSWTLMSPDLTNNSSSLTNIGINRNFPDHVLTASVSGRVWRTTDAAVNWSDITAGLPGRSVNDVASDPANPDRAFAVVGGFNTGHVWEWNAGSGWTDRSAGLPNVPHNTVLMISSDEILIGNDIGVYYSSDGGLTWTPYMEGMPLGAVVTDLKYNIAQNVVTAGTYGNGAWQTALGLVSPILLYESATAPVEIDGNGDALLDPGETWGVQINMRNGGGATAVTPSARLTASLPGITFLDDGLVPFDDILPGLVGTSTQLTRFVVDQDATCGDVRSFDFVDLTTANDPGPFSDVLDVVSITIGGFEPPVLSQLLNDDFDPAPEAGWTHELVDPMLPGCVGVPFVDPWNVASQDAAFGLSYHAGRGTLLPYLRSSSGWLYYGGKDSTGGPGITIPSDAISATLKFDHWYEMTVDRDGGLVALDFLQDGTDNYTVIDPVGGYPEDTIATGNCNAIEGLPAFQGDSNGWVAATFDLLPYKGTTVYPAFVFGSDLDPDLGYGWFIDNVRFEYEQSGAIICNPLSWPGTVPQDLLLDISTPGAIDATWGASCNIGAVPGQQYSIHAGDLNQLRATGAYNHAPVDGLCDKTSPATFTPGPGLEYYLIVPNDGVREGGAGTDSQGGTRPSASAVCGEQRIGECN